MARTAEQMKDIADASIKAARAESMGVHPQLSKLMPRVMTEKMRAAGQAVPPPTARTVNDVPYDIALYHAWYDAAPE